MVASFYEGIIESFNFVAGEIVARVHDITDRNEPEEVWVIPTSVVPKKEWGNLQAGAVFYLAIDGKRRICTLGRTKWRKKDIDQIKKRASKLYEELKCQKNHST